MGTTKKKASWWQAKNEIDRVLRGRKQWVKVISLIVTKQTPKSWLIFPCKYLIISNIPMDKGTNHWLVLDMNLLPEHIWLYIKNLERDSSVLKSKMWRTSDYGGHWVGQSAGAVFIVFSAGDWTQSHYHWAASPVPETALIQVFLCIIYFILPFYILAMMKRLHT